ncbi:MAG: hypothetical protein J6Q60_08580 [Bacteroidaceae bacterium]|nr:hypothetical protein [Bacteroidaceae bacterium]
MEQKYDIQAESFITDFKSSCLATKTEDDVKRVCNQFFKDISRLYGIKINFDNEKTSLHGGRADSIYNHIIFELKKPHLLETKDGVNEALYGRNASDHGIKHYLVNFSLDECHNDESIFINNLLSKIGVGFDGNSFVFGRYKKSNLENEIFEKKKTKRKPASFKDKYPVEFEVSSIFDFENGVKRLLLYTRSTNKIQLTADNLCKSFSSNSRITQKSISYLYELLKNNLKTNTRVATLYNEWGRIFGRIYEKQETDFVKHATAINQIYPISKLDSNADVVKALFVIQTYYSIIIKLLIQNLFVSLKMPFSKVFILKDIGDLRALFYGKKDLFNNYIDNFFEIHFFEWFTMIESIDLNIVNDIILELDKYETTTSVIKPEAVSDVLKKTYESLMPKDLRHLMGEYYTVEWLVDFVINNSDYSIGLDESVLDPTSGSCVFLTHLIKRYKEKYSDILSHNELIEKITNNFVGFDINPIAVLQGKGNYILSLGDITQLERPITIPVYMCDSIMVPTIHAKQKKGANSIKIETVVGNFNVPVLGERIKNDLYLRRLSNCILSDYKTHDEFLSVLKRLDNIDLPEDLVDVSRQLFNQLQSLHLSGKDGFWPIILKNSFAPLFCQQKFDYIMGNPPWIAWKAMSDSYRELSLDIWLSYGIFEKNAYDKITSHDDFAMAVTYVTIDHYLKDKGLACYVLPQTFVKSLKGGEGFRKFEITQEGQQIPFCVESIYDMLKINPFKGIASNKTSIYYFRKGEKMEYPMKNYFEGSIIDGSSFNTDESYENVINKISFERKWAKPINPDIRSPWLTLNPIIMQNLQNYLGESEYRGRKGIEPCGAKGIYLIKVNGEQRGLVKIENLVERSRLEKVKKIGIRQGLIEADLIYPMIGGRNIDKWGINSNVYMLVPHYTTGSGIYRGIPDGDLRTKYPHTYQWLYENFHDILLETRIRSAKFFDPKQFPWYRLDNVGEYTFKPYKMLWKEQSTAMNCCVVSSLDCPCIGNKLVVTDSKVLSSSFDDKNEAFYLCGVLNSSEIEEIIQGYTISTNRGIDIVKNIRIPKYDSNNVSHVQIAKLSIQAHEAYKATDTNMIGECEKEINELVKTIF